MLLILFTIAIVLLHINIDTIWYWMYIVYNDIDTDYDNLILHMLHNDTDYMILLWYYILHNDIDTMILFLYCYIAWGYCYWW